MEKLGTHSARNFYLLGGRRLSNPLDSIPIDGSRLFVSPSSVQNFWKSYGKGKKGFDKKLMLYVTSEGDIR